MSEVQNFIENMGQEELDTQVDPISTEQGSITLLRDMQKASEAVKKAASPENLNIQQEGDFTKDYVSFRKGQPSRITEGRTAQEIKTEQAMAQDYGDFSVPSDPTGIITSGDVAEDELNPRIAESRLKLEENKELNLPDALTLARIYASKPPEEDDDDRDHPIVSRLRALGFGSQKPSPFTGGVPITTERNVFGEMSEHAGLLSVIEGAATVSGMLGKELLAVHAAAPGTVLYGLKDMYNYVKDAFDIDQDDDTTSFAKYHFLSTRKETLEALSLVEDYLAQSAKSVVPIRDDETWKQFWHSIRDPLAVPDKDRDALNIGLSVFGMFAPFAGLGAVKQGSQVLNKVTQNTTLAAYIAHKAGTGGMLKSFFTGLKPTYENLPLRQLYNFDISKQTFPDIGDNLYNIVKDDASFLKQVEKFEKRGLPPEVARKKALNRRRDFISAAGAGALYTMFSSMQESENLSMGMSIMGALVGNSAAGWTRTTAATANNQFNATLSLLMSSTKERREKALKAFADGDSSKLGKGLNGYAKTFLRMNGFTNSDIKEMTAQSFEMGNAVKKEARALTAEADKVKTTINKIEKSVRPKQGADTSTLDELKEREQTLRNSSERLLRQSKEDGVLNDKGLPHGFYLISTTLDSKFNRRTVEFGSKFRQNVLGGENGKEFEATMDKVHDLMNTLHNVAPKAMNKFPLLIEQLTGFAALQAMRNSLVNHAEFSSLNGKVINSDYLTEAERYHKLLSQQAIQLKSVMNELRQSDAASSEILTDFLGVLDNGILKKDLNYVSNRVEALKRLAQNPMNKSLEKLEEYEDELLRISQFGEVGDEVSALKHGEHQKTILQGVFRDTQEKASQGFKNIDNNKSFKDLRINLDSFLTELPEEYLGADVSAPLDNLLVNFAGLDRVSSAREQKIIASKNFKRQLELPEEISQDFYEGAFKQKLASYLDVNVDGTSEQKNDLLNKILLNSDDIASTGDYQDAVNTAIISLVGRVGAPAEVSIESFMRIRSKMALKARTEYNKGNYQDYHDINQRIAALDDTISRESSLGSQFMDEYDAAKKTYREVFSPYLDPKSPFSMFENVSGDGRQYVSSFKLFETLHTPGVTKDYTKNAEEFDRLFFDPETETYKTFEILDSDGAVVGVADPVQELLYSFATRATTNYEGVKPETLDEILSDSILAFSGVLNKSGERGKKFLENLKGYAEYKSVKLYATKQDKDVVKKEFDYLIDNLNQLKLDAFNQSAIVLLGGGKSGSLDKYGIVVREALKSLSDHQVALLERGGRSTDINSVERFEELLKKSNSFKDATPNQQKMILEIANSTEFRKNLNELTGSQSLGGRSAIDVVLSDARKRVDNKTMSEDDYKLLQESSRIMIFDTFSATAFPYIKKLAKTSDVSETSAKALQEISEELQIRPSKVKTLVRTGNQEIIDKLKQKGLTEFEIRKTGLSRFTGTSSAPAYTINLDIEFDPVGAKKWWDEHRETLELIYTDKKGNMTEEGVAHVNAIDSLIQLGTGLTSFSVPQKIKNTPMAMTMQMHLGRVYNSVGKRVVSPTYIGMENLVVNYRLLQANIIRDILISPKTAEFFKDVYAVGLFKPRNTRDFIRDLSVRVAQFGGKMSLQQQDDLMVFFEKEAEQTRKIRQEQEDQGQN